MSNHPYVKMIIGNVLRLVVLVWPSYFDGTIHLGYLAFKCSVRRMLTSTQRSMVERALLVPPLIHTIKVKLIVQKQTMVGTSMVYIFEIQDGKAGWQHSMATFLNLSTITAISWPWKAQDTNMTLTLSWLLISSLHLAVPLPISTLVAQMELAHIVRILFFLLLKLVELKMQLLLELLIAIKQSASSLKLQLKLNWKLLLTNQNQQLAESSM